MRSSINRAQVINALIKAFGYENYLEIGVFKKDRNYNHIECKNKTGVDPDPESEADYIGTSNQFFEDLDTDKKYDIIFIDGDHDHHAATQDIENAIKHLSPMGTILLHDVCYENAAGGGSQLRPEKGNFGTSVWKALAKVRMYREDLYALALDCDRGIGIIHRSSDFPVQGYQLYSQDGLVLGDGYGENDSLSEEFMDNAKRDHYYFSKNCVPANKSYTDFKDNLIHPVWLANYFSDNYRDILNVVDLMVYFNNMLPAFIDYKEKTGT